MATKHMLTTIDNPYNPYSNYDEWDAFDRAAGHHSASLLARITNSSTEISEADQDIALEVAIEEIVRENVSGMHKRIEIKE